MNFLTFVFLVLTSAFALPNGEIQMATVKSDIDNDIGKFYLLTDSSGNVEAIRYTITHRSGEVFEDDTHTWERIRDGGVVLITREGREILRLHVNKDFSPVNGGEVRINYLFSGVTNARRDYYLNLVRSGNGYALKNGAAEINTLSIYGNWSVFFGLVGILNITSSYKTGLYDYDSSFK